MKLKFVERGDEYFTNIVSSDVYGDTENENNNRQDCVTNSWKFLENTRYSFIKYLWLLYEDRGYM